MNGLAYLGFFLAGFGFGGLAGVGVSAWIYKKKVEAFLDNPVNGLFDNDVLDS